MKAFFFTILVIFVGCGTPNTPADKAIDPPVKVVQADPEPVHVDSRTHDLAETISQAFPSTFHFVEVRLMGHRGNEEGYRIVTRVDFFALIMYGMKSWACSQGHHEFVVILEDGKIVDIDHVRGDVYVDGGSGSGPTTRHDDYREDSDASALRVAIAELRKPKPEEKPAPPPHLVTAGEFMQAVAFGPRPQPPQNNASMNGHARIVVSDGRVIEMDKGDLTPPKDFDADFYLKENPDVAAHPYFGKHPYEHYVYCGKTEHRKTHAEK